MTPEEFYRLGPEVGDWVIGTYGGDPFESQIFASTTNENVLCVMGAVLVRAPGDPRATGLSRGDVIIKSLWRPVRNPTMSGKTYMAFNADGSRTLFTNAGALTLGALRYDRTPNVYMKVEADRIFDQILDVPKGDWFETLSDDGFRTVWFRQDKGYSSYPGSATQTTPNPKWVEITPLRRKKRKARKSKGPEC